MINSLRDAAQHHLLDISEQHLYIQTPRLALAFSGIFTTPFLKRSYDFICQRGSCHCQQAHLYPFPMRPARAALWSEASDYFAVPLGKPTKFDLI
jgi:hypothetical protein